MRVTPPQQAPGAQQQEQGPSNPGGPAKPGGAQQAIQQIQSGYGALGKMIEAAGGQLDPQDVKLFQTAVQSANDFFQALSAPAQQQQQAPDKAQPSQPMPDMANKGASPSPQY